MRIRRPCGLMVLTLAAVICNGCAQPDPAPFADGTAALREAIRVAGEQTTATMRAVAAAAEDADERAAILSQVRELERSWKVRLEIVDVCDAYAGAIVRVLERAESDGHFAHALIAALQPLVSAAPVSASLASIAVITHDTLAEIAAVRTLAAAVAVTHPLIDHIAALLREDLTALQMIHRVHLHELRAHAQSDVDARLANEASFTEAALATLEAWRLVHHDLAAALRSNRSLDAELLGARIIELHDAILRFKSGESR